MTVGFKSPVSSPNVNNAFASKTADNTLSGIQTLNNVGSGAAVTNVQQDINDLKVETIALDVRLDQAELDIDAIEAEQVVQNTNIATNSGRINDLETLSVTATEGVRRVTGTNLTTAAEFRMDIDGLVEDTNIDPAADYLVYFDVSQDPMLADQHKKIKPDDFISSMGPGGGTSNDKGFNYILNYGLETDLSGFVTYADAAALSAVDGTGGTPAVTIARNTTTPLAETADLLFTKDAVNRQGQGFSYDFTINRSDLNQYIQVTIDYKTSVNYVLNDVRIFIYDVTNAALIPVYERNLIPSTTGFFRAEFKANSTSLSYRLIVHVSSTSALAYTINFDNFFVGKKSDTQKVMVDAEHTSGAAVVNAGTIIFNSEIRDTHDAYNVATGRFVAPYAANYTIISKVETQAVAAALTQFISPYIQMVVPVSVTLAQSARDTSENAGSSRRYGGMVSKTIWLEQGDAIEIKSESNLPAITYQAVGFRTYLSIISE